MAAVDRSRSFHASVAVREHSVVMLGGYDEEDDVTGTAQLYDAHADRLERVFGVAYPCAVA